MSRAFLLAAYGMLLMNSPKQEADHAPTINERMTALGIPGLPPNNLEEDEMESVERLQKYVGKIKGSRSCPSNPCFTVNNTIEIANYVADLKAQLAAANAEIERLQRESVRWKPDTATKPVNNLTEPACRQIICGSVKGVTTLTIVWDDSLTVKFRTPRQHRRQRCGKQTRS